MKNLREWAAGLALAAGVGGMFGAHNSERVDSSGAQTAGAEGKEGVVEGKTVDKPTVLEEGYREYKVDLDKINSTVEGVTAIDVGETTDFNELVSALLHKDGILAEYENKPNYAEAAKNGRKLIADKLALVLYASDKWVGGSDGNYILRKLVKVLPPETIRQASVLQDSLKKVLQEIEKKG